MDGLTWPQITHDSVAVRTQAHCSD